MTDTQITTGSGSFRTPSFEHARVGDVMTEGVLTCPAGTPLTEAAQSMALNHIHSLVVCEMDEPGLPGRPVGVLSDLDLVNAALRTGVAGATADEAAGTELITVTPFESLESVAQAMADHACAHVVVVDANTGHLAGIVSSLDVAGAIAWGRA